MLDVCPELTSTAEYTVIHAYHKLLTVLSVTCLVDHLISRGPSTFERCWIVQALSAFR